MRTPSLKSYRTGIIYFGFLFGACGLADIYLTSLSPANLMILGMATLVTAGWLARRVDTPAINAKAVVRIVMTHCQGWPTKKDSFLKVAPFLSVMTGARSITLLEDEIKIDNWTMSRQRFNQIANELKLLKD